MTRARRWLLGLAIGIGGGAALFAIGALAFVVLIPSDEALAARVATGLQTALGVKVTVGAVHWRLLPAPKVTVENIATVQDRPVTIRQLTIWPTVSALWQHRLQIGRAEVQGAVVPQFSLRELGQSANTSNDALTLPGGFMFGTIALAHFKFSDLSWALPQGPAVVYSGQIDFDPAWRPRTLSLSRSGFVPATNLALTRDELQDRWEVHINVGGGTADGPIELLISDDSRLHFRGTMRSHNVEIASALSAFGRVSPIAGKASGDTVLTAEGSTMGQLTQSLRSVTHFTVGPSTVVHFDLDKVVRTAGKEYAGQTQLALITGQLDTQNTDDETVTTYAHLKAKTGAFSASGKARIANQKIDVELAVDLVDGVIGVPLKITGPLNNVRFSIPSGTIAGAVVGTALLPGVGTAVGARVGATLGNIFDSNADRLPISPAKK